MLLHACLACSSTKDVHGTYQVHKAKLRGTPAGTANDAAAPAVAARLAVQQRRPSDGVVAVKVQYPDAARTMQQVRSRR